MKTTVTHRVLTLLCLFLFSGATLLAQSKEKDAKADQEAQLQEQQAQKQQQLEQQKKMQELELEFQAQNKKLELEAKQKRLEQEQKMRELEIIYADRAKDYERQARESARESSRARTYVRSSGDAGNYFIYSGDQNSTSQLTLRNSFDGSSESSKGEFEVSEGTRHFRVNINGKVKSGEIRIIVDYPSGDTFKDMVINSAAEISFSQSVSISEEDPDKYVGDWSYKVIAEEAKGSYSVSIMTH